MSKYLTRKTKSFTITSQRSKLLSYRKNKPTMIPNYHNISLNATSTSPNYNYFISSKPTSRTLKDYKRLIYPSYNNCQCNTAHSTHSPNFLCKNLRIYTPTIAKSVASKKLSRPSYKTYKNYSCQVTWYKKLILTCLMYKPLILTIIC